MVINAPSLANIELLNFGREVDELYCAGVRFFHIDIMDGHYVPNLCFPTTVVRELKHRYPDATAEVHLMVSEPMDYIGRLAEYGADYVSFHYDATNFVRRTVTMIREAGITPGVIINPSQAVEIIEPVADIVDYVILMSVEPGFAGQKFLPGSLERLRRLAKFRKAGDYGFKIMIDGGVNYDVAADVVRSGADMIVTNVYMIFGQPDGISGACARFNEALGSIKSAY
ncbi:MAG: ribulose-phosphate 3-epimerase [Oscillospiraceae bacterium]|nr:ribulose-phosphate 3-epimerase [Oscillospiraceae bacterium]